MVTIGFDPLDRARCVWTVPGAFGTLLARIIGAVEASRADADTKQVDARGRASGFFR